MDNSTLLAITCLVGYMIKNGFALQLSDDYGSTTCYYEQNNKDVCKEKPRARMCYVTLLAMTIRYAHYTRDKESGAVIRTMICTV